MASITARNVRERPVSDIAISVMRGKWSPPEAVSLARRADSNILDHVEIDDVLEFGDLGQRTTMRRLDPFLTGSGIAYPPPRKALMVEDSSIFDDELDQRGWRTELSLSGIRTDRATRLGRFIGRPDVGLYFEYESVRLLNGTVLVIPSPLSIIPVAGLLRESGLGVAHKKTRVPVSRSAPYADKDLGERQWVRLAGQSVRLLHRSGSDPRDRTVVSAIGSWTSEYLVPYTRDLKNAARAPASQLV